MKPIFVRQRMTRDEMCAKFPDKYYLILNEERGVGLHIGSLTSDAGALTGYLLAVFDSSAEACSYFDEETKRANDRAVLYSNDYTEEVFNLGFIFTCSKH